MAMPPDHECAMKDRIEALEQANKTHSGTHEKMFDRIRKLETENAVQDAQYKSIEEKLDKIDMVVDELNSKAGKRWDGMVEKVLWLIVGGAISLLLVGMGLPV